MSSGYFDENYYLQNNLEVAAIVNVGIINALDHYIKYGAQEGRNPSALFESARYLKENPDVFLAGVNPIVHWIRSGRKEGRISPERDRRKISLDSICNPYHVENSASTAGGEVSFSILTACYNTKPKYLRELATTILNQIYRDWEWVIVDDGSSSTETINCLKGLQEDTRITVIFQSNGGISVATNFALAAAKGDYIALVDHDDLLARDVLQLVASVIRDEPKTDMIYTDECKISEDGEVYDLSLKPGWSPALLESTMYVGHLTVYRRELIARLGGFRSQFDGTQDYDLALRVALTKPTCAHVPRTGYLWRAIIGSTALGISEKSYAIDRQRLALESFVRQAGRTGSITSGKSTGWWRIDYDPARLAKPVSIVIPTAGGKRLIRGEERDLICSAVDSIKEKRFFSSYEIVVVHNDNLSPKQKRHLASHPEVRLVAYAALEFNLAEKINLGVSSARGDYVLLINDDIEIVSESGGDKMVGYMLADASVGVVGCLCLYENGTVQHNGVVLLEQGASHYGIGRHHGEPGAPLFLQSRRDCFAVTGALMLFSRETFLRLGGYNLGLPINYNDVDFCIRMRETGLRCVIDPCVSIYHYESSTALGGQTLDSELFFRRHPDLNDPFFNPRFDQRNPWLQITDRSKPALSFSSPEVFGPWLNKRIGERRSMVKAESDLRLTVGMPVFNQPARLLTEALRSVKLQTWPNVEIVIVDDGSTLAETVAWLDAIKTSGDQRVIRHERNLGIAGANRTLLASATGDFLLPVDADDWVTIDALEILARAILANPRAKIFYSDEFKSDLQSQQFSPFYKPDFDPVLLMNCCYPTHLMAINVAWARTIGAYSDDRAQWCHDYDVLTRSLARGEEPVHVPELLYAWRINPGSTASETSGTKPYTFESQRFVLERLIAELGKAADVGVCVNPLFDTPAMWMLEAKRDLERTSIVNASRILEAPDLIHKSLVDKAFGSAFVHISSSGSVNTTQAALAAPILFDERVLACSGLIKTDKERIAWSGGFVLGVGLVHDPYIGAEASDSGYHGQLFCQRRVDVPSPIEMLVRSDILSLALQQIDPKELTPDKLAIHIALQVNTARGFCVTTPHVVFYPGARVAEFVPLDRAQALRNAGFEPSNLYNPQLSRELAYQADR